MPGPIDKNGNVHDHNGRFVNLQEYIEMILEEREKQVERVFAERETSAEFKRLALKDALDEAKLTTALALAEAKVSTKQELDNAKAAADERERVIQTRLDKLEAGGAPFADRLNEAATKLRTDVDTLNTDAVRTKVLDALRVQQTEDAKNQRRQIRVAMVGAGVAAAIALVNFLVSVVQ